jgi:hypothetical protein
MGTNVSNRPHGKYVRIDQDNPQALGICDFTGFVTNRRDMVKQMEWRGNRLIWTGFLVNAKFADTPNPQLKPPLLRPDPYPTVMPRPPQYSVVTWALLDEPEWQYVSEIYPGYFGPNPETLSAAGFEGNFYGNNDLAYLWENWGAYIIDDIEAEPVQERQIPLNHAYFGA